MCFENGLPRQSADWLAMTGFFDKLSGGTKSLRYCIYSLASCSKRSSATGFTAGAQALNSSTTRSR